MSDDHVGEFIRSQQQWEYQRLEAPAAEALTDEMKVLGRDGWELSGVVYSPAADIWHAFLKRPRAYAE